MSLRDGHRVPVVGECVGRYEILAPLATGGMGAILVGRLSGVGGFRKLLAVKVLKPELADDPYFVEMFLDECRIVSQLSHRNVVSVFDVVVHNGLPCMVMEFLRGRPLSAVVRELARDGMRIPDALAACILAQTAEGLRAAHALRDADGEPMHLVHRDISPDNIQICHDGAVKILDFGIASTRARLESTRHDSFKGKVAYAAPERISAPQTVDARADAWSLGVMAWELFAGRKLFVGESEAELLWKVINQPIPSLRDERPDLPAALVDAVMALLVRTVRDRAADLGAFAATLSELGARAEPQLGRLVSEQFDLDEEHDVLLRTIARELEAASVRPRAATPPARRSRQWAFVGAALVALAATGVGLQIVWAQADDAPAQMVSPVEVATPRASPGDRVDAAEPEPSPAPIADAVPTSPSAPAVADAPEPSASPTHERNTSARTRARSKKKPRPPKKRQDGIFRNPYDKPQ